MVLQSSGSRIIGVYRLNFMLVLSTTDERERAHHSVHVETLKQIHLS